MACAAPAASSLPPAPAGGDRGVWVIFQSSGRYRFVARKFLCTRVFTFMTDDEVSAETLDEVRALLPSGLVGRTEQWPNVVETWA